MLCQCVYALVSLHYCMASVHMIRSEVPTSLQYIGECSTGCGDGREADGQNPETEGKD